MNETLKTILDMDKTARLKVEEAEEYRREAIAGLGSKKAQIIEDATQKVKKSAARRNERRKAEGEKMLSDMKTKNHEMLEKMESLYKAHGDEWVNDIVKNIIEQ